MGRDRQNQRGGWVERGREKKRETDVRASMTGRDNLIIILMWDVMNNSHRTDSTHKQIHTQSDGHTRPLQRPEPPPPTTTPPKVSTSAFITWNNTLPCVHSSVALRLMHCTVSLGSFRRLLRAKGRSPQDLFREIH